MIKMNTYTKKCFNPIYMQEKDVDIRDIAHALSLICRGNGHIDTFYSVAQHSINCTLEAKARNHSQNVQLACLLHDASEAYIADLIRPVKIQLSEYTKIETHILNTIFSKYNIDLSDIEKKQVKDIDNDLLVYDLKHLLHAPSSRQIHLKVKPDIREKNYRDVEQQFLALFHALRI